MKEFDLQKDLIYFVDTNIWLYSFILSQDQKKTKISQSIIKNADIIISTQIINERRVNLIKKAGFSEWKIQRLITSLYQKYTIFELSKEIFVKASETDTHFPIGTVLSRQAR